MEVFVLVFFLILGLGGMFLNIPFVEKILDKLYDKMIGEKKRG